MPYQPQPPMDANNTPGLAPRAQLPQNIEAEQSVLAACLLNGEVTEEAVMRLRPENFFRPAHRIIFEAIISLTNRHIPVDPIALADTLKSTGQLEAVGGRAYLAELADNTFSLTSWERHVDIVKRQSILRELVFAATQINALAYDAPDDLDQVVEEAEKTLFNVTEKRVSSSFRKMDELVSDATRRFPVSPIRRTRWPAFPRASRTSMSCSTGFAAATWLFWRRVPVLAKPPSL